MTRRVHDCPRRAQGSPSPECRVLFATVCAPAPDSLSPLRLAFFLSPRSVTSDDVSVSVASRFWRVCSSRFVPWSQTTRGRLARGRCPVNPNPGVSGSLMPCEALCLQPLVDTGLMFCYMFRFLTFEHMFLLWVFC